MEQPAQIITVADLKKYYTVGPNTVKALDGVSLDVKSGEFVGVMGRSGSGKSTLLNMLAGLESPTDGFLEIDGEPVGILSERKRIQFRRNNAVQHDCQHRLHRCENRCDPVPVSVPRD